MPVAPTSSHAASGGDSTAQFVRKLLSAADILALGTTPIKIIDAPGAGYAILPTVLNGWASYRAGLTPFTINVNGSGQEGIYLFPQGGTVYTSGWVAADGSGFIDQATNKLMPMTSLVGVVWSTSVYENAAVYVGVPAGSSYTAGDGTVELSIPYSIVTL